MADIDWDTVSRWELMAWTGPQIERRELDLTDECYFMGYMIGRQGYIIDCPYTTPEFVHKYMLGLEDGKGDRALRQT